MNLPITFIAAMIFVSFNALANGTTVTSGPEGGSQSPYSGPYSGQETREIKSLSSADIEALLAGKGMGLAKAAELNGWPGPRHVIDLAKELQLSSSQLSDSQALFKDMQSKAARLGQEIIAAEKRLDQLFRQEAVSAEVVRAATSRIARIKGELRAVHLNAHLAQASILTAEQRSRYVELRGYGHSSNGSHEKGKHQH